MTVEKMENIDIAKLLTEDCLRKVDRTTLEAIYYDDRLGYYSGLSKEDLIEEFKDRELEVE